MSNSRSLKVLPLQSFGTISYSHSVATMAVYTNRDGQTDIILKIC